MECEGEKFSYTSRAGSSSVRTGECTIASGNTDTGICRAEEKTQVSKCVKHSFFHIPQRSLVELCCQYRRNRVGYPAGTALPGGTSGQTFLSSAGSGMAGEKWIFAFLQTMGIQRKLCKIYRCRTDTGNRLFLCHKSVRYSDGSSGCLPAVGGFSTGLPYGGHNGT